MRMSNEQLQQQHETINTIARQVSTITKWWPAVTLICGIVATIASLSIAGYKYQDNLVRKDDYAKLVKVVERMSADQKTYQSLDSARDNARYNGLTERLEDINKRINMVRGAVIVKRSQSLVVADKPTPRWYTQSFDENGTAHNIPHY